MMKNEIIYGRRYSIWTDEDKYILKLVMEEQRKLKAHYRDAIKEAAIELGRTPNAIKLKFNDYQYYQL